MWILELKGLSLHIHIQCLKTMSKEFDKRSKRFPLRDQVIHSQHVFSSVRDVGHPRDIQRVKLSIGGVQFSGLLM